MCPGMIKVLVKKEKKMLYYSYMFLLGRICTDSTIWRQMLQNFQNKFDTNVIQIMKESAIFNTF